MTEGLVCEGIYLFSDRIKNLVVLMLDAKMNTLHSSLLWDKILFLVHARVEIEEFLDHFICLNFCTQNNLWTKYLMIITTVTQSLLLLPPCMQLHHHTLHQRQSLSHTQHPQGACLFFHRNYPIHISVARPRWD